MIVINFDLDGTVYNLYGVNQWLERLRNEDVTVYTVGERLFDEEFYIIVSALLSHGVMFNVITWGSMTATPQFDILTEQAKTQWVKEHLPFVKKVNYQPYGTPKAKAVKNGKIINILIDDSKKVLDEWTNGKSRLGYQVTEEKSVTDILRQILKQIEKEK